MIYEGKEINQKRNEDNFIFDWLEYSSPLLFVWCSKENHICMWQKPPSVLLSKSPTVPFFFPPRFIVNLFFPFPQNPGLPSNKKSSTCVQNSKISSLPPTPSQLFTFFYWLKSNLKFQLVSFSLSSQNASFLISFSSLLSPILDF